MTARKFIVLGDTTTHSGMVVTAWGQDGPTPMTIDGKPVACVGDKVTCPRCKGVHTIISGAEDPPMELHGRLLAREGDYVSDSSRLISTGQSSATHDNEYDAYATAGAASAAAAAMANVTPPPASQGILSASAEGGITAEEARLLAEQQKDEKKGFVAVFINNNGRFVGEHVSVFVGDMNDANRILYDPCGNYDKNKVKGELGTRGGDVLSADQYEYDSYYNYHREDGPDIRIYPFKITKEEENEIRNRILDPELLSSCDMDCTVRTREVLRGIGLFKHLKPSGTMLRRTPKSLTEDMEIIKRIKQ